MTDRKISDDPTGKLYLTKEEYLENDLIYILDEEGNSKLLKMKVKGSDEANSDSPKAKVRTNKRRIIEDDELEADFPKELTAGFWVRFFAFIVDAIIASALGSILVDGPLNLFALDVNETVYRLLLKLVFLLYFTIASLITNGQSLGKIIFGLRVVRMDGEKLDFFTTIIREFFGRFIHEFSFLRLLYVITAFTEYHQNLSDIFADTTVVDLSKVSIYEKSYALGEYENKKVYADA